MIVNDRSRDFLARYVFPTLQGMTFGDWWSVLRRHRFAVDPRYWPKALMQTALSVSNSLNSRREEKLFGDQVASVRVPPPVFILGHWRSGTTHLHNLLTLDPRFACPNLLQAYNPLTFLRMEAKMAPVADRLTIRRRPQDDVAVDAGSPTEDEFGLCAMTGFSPYMEWTFPRGAHDYDKYLTFQGVPSSDVARWQAALRLLLKKLTFKYGRPLILKSPPHTARIRLLLETAPDARFIHIHRNPYTVYRSTKHLFKTIAPYLRFQRGGSYDTDDRVIGTYTEMYDAYFAERSLIPKERFCEIGFEELERDPVGVIGSVYESLALPGFEGVRPALDTYLVSLAGYRKNAHAELPEPIRQRIAREWHRSFETWGYDE